MSNQAEDIQAAGSDTRPPMLDMTDFESWQQQIWLYCKGKDHGEYILQSIDEGPFKMGRYRDEIASGTDGAYLGLKQDRVVADLSQAKKDRLRTDNRVMNILLHGSELTKDDRESQLYDESEHFEQHKGENIHDYYVRFVTEIKLNRDLKESNHYQLYAYLKQHELHANKNKILMERLNQHSHDPLALVSNVSPYQYPSLSSDPPQPSYIPPVTYQPQFTDNTQLDTSFSLTGELLDNLTKQVALLAQQYKTQFPQTNNQLRTSFNTHNQATVQNGRVLDMAQNKDNVFQADQCNAFDSNVDEAPTAQTMFMANLSSTDPVYDEPGLSYDSDILSEVQDHDNCLDNMNESHKEHEMRNAVQQDDVVDLDTEYTSNSNIISYTQYVQDNEDQVVHSVVSYVPNDAVIIITNDVYAHDAQCVTSNKPNNTVNASLTVELARYKELAEVYEKRAQFEL
nr:hypothetical protein [Tanacetum cinerariifolium]